MSANIFLVRLTKLDSAYLDQVEPMFYDYYKSMEDKGIFIRIVDGGGRLWRKGIENVLGRTQFVVISLADDKVAGFSWAYITISPSYMGSIFIGVWNALYVAPEYRALGLSKLMYLDTEKWFIEKNVHSIEAYSLMGNTHSMKGIKNMGFSEELIQYRKLRKV
jgi:GNAT superfamily N-acetyltransferase